MTVTLALIGDPARPGAPVPPTEFERPWAGRRKVDLEVAEGETLASLVLRALDAFGVAESSVGLERIHMAEIGLYDGTERVRVWDMTLVDDRGRALWTAHDLRLIPYSQLTDSVAAGAVDGDAERLYVVLREPIGNGIGIDWPTIIQAWEVIDHVVARVGQYGGAAAAVAAAAGFIRARLGRGRQAIDENVQRISQAGASPYALARFLDDKPWSAALLAEFLGSSEDDAVAILELFGFAFDASTTQWRRGQDLAASILASAFEEAAAAEIAISEAGRRDFETRIEQLVRTGEPPPPVHYFGDDDVPAWEELQRRERVKQLAMQGTLAVGGFLAGILLRRRSSR